MIHISRRAHDSIGLQLHPNHVCIPTTPIVGVDSRNPSGRNGQSRIFLNWDGWRSPWCTMIRLYKWGAVHCLFYQSFTSQFLHLLGVKLCISFLFRTFRDADNGWDTPSHRRCNIMPARLPCTEVCYTRVFTGIDNTTSCQAGRSFSPFLTARRTCAAVKRQARYICAMMLLTPIVPGGAIYVETTLRSRHTRTSGRKRKSSPRLLRLANSFLRNWYLYGLVRLIYFFSCRALLGLERLYSSRSLY